MNMSPNQFSLTLFVAVGVMSIAWLLFANLLAPVMIAQAYRGESLAFLNAIIAHQATHPLSDYLHKWEAIALWLLWILIGTGMTALVLTRPEFQRYWDSTQGASAHAAGVATMRRWRVGLVYACVLLITGGSLFDIVTDQEHWPLSNYPMYAEVRAPTLRVRRLYGVTPHGEIPLAIHRYLPPFVDPRLLTAFKRLSRRPARDRLLTTALQSCLERYEVLRRAQVHDGPSLVGLRLYELEWRIASWARNREQPHRKTLLYEVLRAE